MSESSTSSQSSESSEEDTMLQVLSHRGLTEEQIQEACALLKRGRLFSFFNLPHVVVFRPVWMEGRNFDVPVHETANAAHAQCEGLRYSFGSRCVPFGTGLCVHYLSPMSVLFTTVSAPNDTIALLPQLNVYQSVFSAKEKHYSIAAPIERKRGVQSSDEGVRLHTMRNATLDLAHNNWQIERTDGRFGQFEYMPLLRTVTLRDRTVAEVAKVDNVCIDGVLVEPHAAVAAQCMKYKHKGLKVDLFYGVQRYSRESGADVSYFEVKSSHLSVLKSFDLLWQNYMHQFQHYPITNTWSVYCVADDDIYGVLRSGLYSPVSVFWKVLDNARSRWHADTSKMFQSYEAELHTKLYDTVGQLCGDASQKLFVLWEQSGMLDCAAHSVWPYIYNQIVQGSAKPERLSLDAVSHMALLSKFRLCIDKTVKCPEKTNETKMHQAIKRLKVVTSELIESIQ